MPGSDGERDLTSELLLSTIFCNEQEASEVCKVQM